MEEACQGLERAFKKLNNDVDHAFHRLEAESRSSVDRYKETFALSTFFIMERYNVTADQLTSQD